MNYERPLSNEDLRGIAEYLFGTDEELYIALSELGFDPLLYDEMDDWLKEIGLIRDEDTNIWRMKHGT